LQNKKIGLFDKALDSNVLSQLNDLLAWYTDMNSPFSIIQ
jgi:hypothetical protein